LWLLGYPDRAVTMSNDAVSLARQLKHPVSLIVALQNAAIVFQLRRERHATARRVEELNAVFPGFPFPDAFVLSGWASADPGGREIDVMRGALAKRINADEFFQPYFIAVTVEVCIALGRTDDARDLVSSALDIIDRTGERWYEAELHRLKGELCLLAAGSESEGEEHFRRAIAFACAAEAKSLELRATTSLASLLAKGGKRDEARAMLAAIYNWFTEGFDTADLKDAKALLDELSE